LTGLKKRLVAPLTKAEFEKMVEQYIDKLTSALGGEV
jgi:hypothetical protein